MKKNKKLAPLTIWFCAAALLLAVLAACRATHTSQAGEEGIAARRPTTDNDSRMTLIPDYSGMAENDWVAAAWIESGFTLEQCRRIKVYPVLNYSRREAAGVQQKLQKALEQLYAQHEGRDRGVIDAGVLSALIAVKPKTELLKRFSPSFDDIPSLTIELIIIDEATKKTLCKLCHSAKDEEFSRAFDAVVNDLRLFMARHL